MCIRDSLLEAVIEAGVVRFRPIVITSITTFVGLTPIMLEPSVQANFLKPAVISLTWGVVLCAPVTLILAPCLMVIGADIVDLFSKIPSILKKQVSPKAT